MARPQIGQEIANRYILQERLGGGSTGEVFRAVHRELNQLVAIKFLEVGGLDERKPLQRLRIEARAQARLRHDAIVRLLDVLEVVGAPLALVMEYVPGETLAARLRRLGPLPVEDVVRLGRRVADALETAHRLGVLHRDIKPSNLLLPEGDVHRVKIGDFGFAGQLELSTGLTRPGLLIGTPSYMSPEQARGGRVGPAGDIWGLGVTLYEAAYGRPPFAGSSFFELLSAIATAEPEYTPGLPYAFEVCLRRALEKEARNRYASMLDFAEALAVVGGEPVEPAREPAALGRHTEAARRLEREDGSQPRRSSTRWIWLAVGAMAIALALSSYWISAWDAGPVAPTATPAWREARWRIWLSIVGVSIASPAVVWAAVRLFKRLQYRVQRRRTASKLRSVSATDPPDAQALLSQSMAIALHSLMEMSASHPAIDLRRASLALAIQDCHEAEHRDDQREALERAVAIADSLDQWTHQYNRPWYVRHKDVLTVLATFVTALAALISSVVSALK